MAFTGANGLTGELRVGGRPAAGLRDWSLTPAAGGAFDVRATLVEPVDLLLGAGRPVEVRLNIGKRIWRWRGGELSRAGSAATVAVVGDWETM